MFCACQLGFGLLAACVVLSLPWRAYYASLKEVSEEEEGGGGWNFAILPCLMAPRQQVSRNNAYIGTLACVVMLVHLRNLVRHNFRHCACSLGTHREKVERSAILLLNSLFPPRSTRRQAHHKLLSGL